MINFVPAGVAMAITSDEVNYLVYRYLQESGAHSAVLCIQHTKMALAAELLGMRTNERAQARMLRLRPKSKSHCVLEVLQKETVGYLYLGVNNRVTPGGSVLTVASLWASWARALAPELMQLLQAQASRTRHSRLATRASRTRAQSV